MSAAVRNERGIALLIVLIVVALLTITVTEFTYSVQIDQHRTRNAMHAMQASLLARSGVNIMEGFLVLDGTEPNRDDVTWYGEEWYLQLQEFCAGLEIEESTLIKCVVKDESNKININRTKEPRRPPTATTMAVSPSAVVRTAMKCFFTKAGIHLDVIEDLTAYWQQDAPLDAQGRELPVPEFESLESFASTIGRGRISTAQLAQIRPFLTAVPTQPQTRPGQPRTFNRSPGINVNTAPGPVLMAILGDECATNDAVIHVQELQQTGEPIEPAQLAEIVNLKAEGEEDKGLRNATKQLLGVDSNFWRLEASVMTNVDPENPEGGGIGQTLSELVERRKKPAGGGNLGAGVRGGTQQGDQPLWTLRTLDWQKEGGARLFHEQPAEDDLHPMDEENEEQLDERTSR